MSKPRRTLTWDVYTNEEVIYIKFWRTLMKLKIVEHDDIWWQSVNAIGEGTK